MCASGEIYVEKLCSDYASTIDGGIMLMVFLNLMFLIIYPLFERKFVEKFIGKTARNIIYNLMQTFLVGFNVYIGYIYLITKDFDFVFGLKKYVMWLFTIIIIGLSVGFIYRHRDKFKEVIKESEEKENINEGDNKNG